MQALLHGWIMIYWCKGVTKTDLLNCLNQLISDYWFDVETKG